MSPALRDNQTGIKNSLSSFHSLFLLFELEELLSTDSYLSQIIILLLYIGFCIRKSSFCLLVLMSAQDEWQCRGKYCSFALLIKRESKDWGRDLLNWRQPERTLIQQKYPKHVLENVPFTISSVWQSYRKAEPTFSFKTCHHFRNIMHLLTVIVFRKCWSNCFLKFKKRISLQNFLLLSTLCLQYADLKRATIDKLVFLAVN